MGDAPEASNEGKTEDQKPGEAEKTAEGGEKKDADTEDATGSERDSDYDVYSAQGYSQAHIMYGEEYEGEAFFYLPSPRPSQESEAKESVEEIAEEEEEEEEEEAGDEKVVEGKTDEISETSERESNEDEVRGSSSVSQPGSEDLKGISTELFDSLFLAPKEKTVSEIKFEREHREFIEEEMRKVLQGITIKEQIVEEKRRPLEKEKLSLTDVDISGLYPQPKTLESEVSFAFEEEEDAEKVQTTTEVDERIVKNALEVILLYSKGDPDSTISPDNLQQINRVQRVLQETVSMYRKGTLVNIPKAIMEALPELKSNMRNAAIQVLREGLTKTEKIFEVEEELEIKKTPQKETPRAKTALSKETPAFKLYAKAEAKAEKVKGPVEKIPEKLVIPKAPSREEKLAETVPEEAMQLPAAQKEEFEMPEVYQKIDWELFLTESEKKFREDPTLKLEMEKFIQRRKKELLLERRAEKEMMAREERYKSNDPLVMLENMNLNVTMKFVLNSGEIFTCAYRYFMTFKEIKEDLAGIFKVPSDILIIYRGDVEVKDEERAYDLQPRIQPFDCVTFRLLTFDNDRWRLKSSHLELPVPDIITCTVETGKDHRGVSEYKEVVVEIEQRKIKKPFVGGYRDVATGIEYHHAFSQSAPRAPSVPYDKRVSTDTQTADLTSKCVDTDCNKYTQMSRSDFYVGTENDKIMTVKPYVDYETWIKRQNIEAKILVIQRYVRAMIIRRFIKKMSDEYQARKIWEEEQERKRAVNREIRIKQDILNLVYPKTKADFEALYAMVERWRKAQVERISKLKTEAPRKAELCGVLEKEIKLLEAIEIHRIAVAKEQKKKKEMDFLAMVSKPVTWTGYRGMTITMDTLKTQRARELRELYLELSRDDLNYQDRIELIISLKYALRVNCTRLTDELTELLNRECELLIRGVSSDKLEYLRRRIDHLFFKYFKEPDFNPEAAKYDPEYNLEPLRRNFIFCKMCHQMKMIGEFSGNARDAGCNVCQSCKTTFNIAVPRIDLSPYRYILKCVRKEEQKKNCYSSCAFVLQDEDMRFLVENIWHSRSAISEIDTLMDLRMPRWEQEKEWTPWNCILLTEVEAKAHVRSHPSLNYEPQLVGEITSKHLLAKRHFQQMFKTEERMRDSGKWANVVDVKEYVPPPITADLWDITESECAKIKDKGAFYEVHETRRKEDNYVKYI